MRKTTAHSPLDDVWGTLELGEPVDPGPEQLFVRCIGRDGVVIERRR
ncbi:MAG: hypothetical protein IVW53_04970 [Chloroflexi bacterium]|nr:hypothetical protein [Chloroflexota bacterium]